MMGVPPNNFGEVERDVAAALAKVAHFVSPKVVRHIAELNRRWQSEFESHYGSKIHSPDYFYNGSACVFPGVRRRGSKDQRELGRSRLRKHEATVGAILDDNVFPRHLWCFLCLARQYTGPTWRDSCFGQFELAHVLPHRAYELEGVKEWFEKTPPDEPSHGLFSCAANTILLPKGMAKPTDGTAGIRLAVLKRYFDLYGESHAGGFTGLRLPDRMTWYAELKWNEPVAPPAWEDHIAKLDAFRKKRIRSILANLT